MTATLRRADAPPEVRLRGVGTMLCAFCEDTVVGHAIRRGGQMFCSPECVEGFYLTMADELEDDEAEDEEDELDLYDDESTQGNGGREFREPEYGRYALDHGEDDDDRF